MECDIFLYINIFNMENKQVGHTVLVVEDDLNLLNLLSDQFERESFKVFRAKDGEEGFSMANENHPDLIILDILLPKMSGLKMMDELRKDGSWAKKVPIFLLTNVSPDESEILKTVAEDKPSYYIVKSNWNMSDIISKAKERLSKSR